MVAKTVMGILVPITQISKITKLICQQIYDMEMVRTGKKKEIIRH